MDLASAPQDHPDEIRDDAPSDTYATAPVSAPPIANAALSAWTHPRQHIALDTDLGTALSRIAEAAKAALGADRATCYAYDLADQRVGSVHTTETDPALRARIQRARGLRADDFPLWRHQLVNGDPLLLIEDTTAHPSVPDAVMQEVGAHSLIAVRLEHHEVETSARPTLLGALFCSFGTRRSFSTHDCSIARGLASLASLALGHAHLRVQTARTLQRVRALEAEQAALRRVATQVAEMAGGAGDIYSLVARETAALLGVDGALVARFDGDRAIVEGASSPTASAEGVLPLEGPGALSTVARTGAAAVIDDYEVLDPASAVRREADRRGYRASAAVPVRVGGRLWGGIIAGTARTEGVPDGAIESLSRFADLVGLTIANAETRSTLVEQATRDPLTGLANSRTFFERMEAERRRATRHGRPLSLVMFDLDHFKRINDTFGHPTGDRVLVEFSARVKALTRSDDLLGRTGGEEFAWLIPEASLDEAFAASERAREAIAGHPFPGVGLVTVSAGVATREPGSTTFNLFEVADAALYRAKAEGRNRCARADGSPTATGGEG